MQHDSLYNKPVEFYLGESNEDSVPIFRGFVKRFTPSETKLTIEALDVRTFLTGNNAIKITSTDEKNYDGKTLGQFLYDIIKDKINVDKTIIDIDMLKDMDKPISMTGYRGVNDDAYKVISDKIANKMDDDDLENVLGYFVDVKEGPEHSGVVIALGSIVFLDVDDDDIYGNHRVVGKNISFGRRFRCRLKLNKKPIKLSNYIQ
jgi:hypothetical protein